MTRTGKRKKHSLPALLLAVGLTALCVNPGITQGHENMNVLLNGVLCLSPFVLLIKGARVFIPRIDIPLGIVMAGVILFPVLFHPEAIRWTTMGFTCAYCIFFMMLARLARISGIKAQFVLKLIKLIVYAFALVLLIQQLCVLMGWPVLLKAMVYDSPWKLNSLTAEPSHTTVTLATVMLFFTLTYVHDKKRKGESVSFFSCLGEYWLVWLCYLWVIITTQNASAIVLGPFCLLPFVNRRNAVWVVIGVMVMAGLVMATPIRDNYQLKRVTDTACAITTLNDSAIIQADESASARLVPTLRGARIIDPTDFRTYIGYGVDADMRDTPPRPCDDQQRGFAGVFSMWHNYGAITAIAFWTTIAFVTLVRRQWISILVFLFALQMSAEHNMQLVWMIMAYSMVCKYRVFDCDSLLDTLPKNEKAG